MLVLGVFDSKSESKYKPISLYKKKTKNFSKPFFVTINGEVTISKALKHIELNRYTVFIVVLSDNRTKFIDEKSLEFLSIKYPINTTFDEVYIK